MLILKSLINIRDTYMKLLSETFIMDCNLLWITMAHLLFLMWLYMAKWLKNRPHIVVAQGLGVLDGLQIAERAICNAPTQT